MKIKNPFKREGVDDNVSPPEEENLAEQESEESDILESDEETLEESQEKKPLKDNEEKEITGEEILINHEQRIANLEAAFFRLKSI